MQEIIHGVPLQHYIWLSCILFSIGVMGVLYRRNAIIIFMCVELMLNAVNLMLVAFSRYHSATNGSSAQVFVFFIMAVAAAEVAVGLAILMMVYRNTKSTDIDFLNRLKF